ncbi:MAG: MarR family transcriptional regulator [Gordonia sp. (in: high G+C Gram-positive bacteria)]
MSHPKLTGTQSLVLFILMAESSEVRNPDLAKLGPELKKSDREKLNALGLIESTVRSRTYHHILTDKGWAWCAAELESEPPERATPQLRAFYAVANGLGRYLKSEDLRLHEVFGRPRGAEKPETRTAADPPVESDTASAGVATAPGAAHPVEAQIVGAYNKARPRPGAFVGVAALRAALPGVARIAFDAAIIELQTRPGVSLIRQEDQALLTDTDREAAVVVGTQPCHLFAIEEGW